MYVFGSGSLIATPPGGTPVNVGLIESCDLTMEQALKELMGPMNSPLAIGAGQIKVTGKAKMARHTPLVFSALFDGVPLTAGATLSVLGEAHTVPGTPTVTVTNAATFSADLGVTYPSYAPLTKVASAPAVGQYSVSNVGVYSFAVGDELAAVLISYDYTVSTGTSSIVSAKLLGPTVSFALDLYGYDTSGAQYGIHMPSCVASKMMFSTKNSDFAQPEIDFMATADPVTGFFYKRFWSVAA